MRRGISNVISYGAALSGEIWGGIGLSVGGEFRKGKDYFIYRICMLQQMLSYIREYIVRIFINII